MRRTRLRRHSARITSIAGYTWAAAAAGVILLLTAYLVPTLLDRAALDDAERERIYWSDFRNAGCPGELPDEADERTRCEWEAKRKRCTDYDVCWYRCTLRGEGRMVGGGCAHLCNALVPRNRPLTYSPGCPQWQKSSPF